MGQDEGIGGGFRARLGERLRQVDNGEALQRQHDLEWDRLRHLPSSPEVRELQQLVKQLPPSLRSQLVLPLHFDEGVLYLSPRGRLLIVNDEGGTLRPASRDDLLRWRVSENDVLAEVDRLTHKLARLLEDVREELGERAGGWGDKKGLRRESALHLTSMEAVVEELGGTKVALGKSTERLTVQRDGFLQGAVLLWTGAFILGACSAFTQLGLPPEAANPAVEAVLAAMALGGASAALSVALQLVGRGRLHDEAVAAGQTVAREEAENDAGLSARERRLSEARGQYEDLFEEGDAPNRHAQEN